MPIPGFVAKYFAMLEAGGSKHHSELLAPFGLNASDPGFWRKGLQVIEGMIDELEALDRRHLAAAVNDVQATCLGTPSACTLAALLEQTTRRPISQAGLSRP